MWKISFPPEVVVSIASVIDLMCNDNYPVRLVTIAVAGLGEFTSDGRHRQWAGRAFHERFDIQATDKAVKTACRKARGDYDVVRLQPTASWGRAAPV